MEVSLAGNDCWIHYKPRCANLIRRISMVWATLAGAVFKGSAETFAHLQPKPHITYLARNWRIILDVISPDKTYNKFYCNSQMLPANHVGMWEIQITLACNTRKLLKQCLTTSSKHISQQLHRLAQLRPVRAHQVQRRGFTMHVRQQ